MEEDRVRVIVRASTELLDVDRARCEVDRVDRADLLALGVVDLVAFARVDLLRRKTVLLQRRLPRFEHALEREARQCSPLVGELVLLEVAQPEVIPPGGFVLAA